MLPASIYPSSRHNRIIRITKSKNELETTMIDEKRCPQSYDHIKTSR